MKLAVIFLTVGMLQVSANGVAQNVTYSGKDVSLEQVFNAIKKQTGYVFFYRNDDVSKSKPVTVQLKDVPLNSALETLLEGQPLGYKVIGKTIVVTKKKLTNTQSFIQEPGIESSTVDINGRVMDENRKPLEGVSVMVKGTKKGTSTDSEGYFTIGLADRIGVLIFSRVGYESREIKLKDETFINVILKVKLSTEDDVIISTGIFNKVDKSFTGASTTITAKQLQEFGNRNIITSLHNIDPSFNIIESNTFGSDPNRLPEVQIRGNSSIPNIGELQNEARKTGLNTPLIILDGFQSSLQKMLDMNINEVETVTILKDAAATAIYGSRGSNGVVVITTKAPRAGKLRVSLRSDINIETPDLSDYHLLNAKDKLELENIAGYYNSKVVETDLSLKRYYNFLVNEVNRGVETDWMSIPLRNGIGQRHNLRLEGGDKIFRYAASVQLNDISGVMKGSNRNTLNGAITLSYNLKNIRIKNNFQILEGKSNESPYGSFADYTILNPYWKPYDVDGNVLKFLGDPGNLGYTAYWTTLPTNPLYNATLSGFNKLTRTEYINNTSVEMTLTHSLIMRFRLGLTKGGTQSDRFRPADNTAFSNYTGDDIFRRGDYSFGTGNYFNYDGSVNLSYSQTFNKNHFLFAGLDYNARQNKSTNYSFMAEGFTNPRFDFISSALQYAQGGRPGGSESLTRAIGMTGNVNYAYANKYMVDGSVRMDGSSQFGAKKRFAPFWALGLGWNLNEENFLKNNKNVNKLKLRGSVGITGSQNFNTYQALSTYRYFTNDRYFNWMGTSLLGIGNENLQWQQTRKLDIGIDAEFFGRRLRITTDYYEELTKDLISSITLPASHGFISYVENIGSLRNIGYEIRASLFLFSKPDFSWSVTGAAIHNKNEILQISQALREAQEPLKQQTGLPGKLYEVGYSSNTIWAVPSLGIDPSTGKELFLGKDGEPTYVWDGSNVAAVGTTEPELLGNFSTMVRYKTLSLNASFGFRFGGQQYNQTLIQKVESGNYKYNVDERVYTSRWKQPGDISAFKGLLVTTPTYKTSRFVQDENTLNCQNVTLQWDVRSASLLEKFRLEAFSLGANMSDVFYLSSIRRERGTSYPFSKQISFYVNAIF